MPEETAEEAAIRWHEEYVKRQARKHQRTFGNEGIVFLGRGEKDPLIKALNEVLKKERLRNVN